MNSFSGLRQEKTDPDVTIMTGPQLKKQKKKLRALEGKEQTPENLKKRKRLTVAIEEYENKDTSQGAIKQTEANKAKKQKAKKTKKQKANDDEDFLEKAFREANTPEHKQAKQAAEDALQRKEDERQRKEDERRDAYRQEQQEKQRQEQQREREEHQWRERQEQQWREQQWRQQRERQRQQEEHRPREKTPEDKITELQVLLKLHNVPEDIISLVNDYNKQGYRKLSLKYHPDRPGGTTEFSTFLNMVKDHHEPNIHVPDETWVK